VKPASFSGVFKYIEFTGQDFMWQQISQNIQSKLAELGAALSFAPLWAVSIVILVAAVIVAWLIHAAILAILRRLASAPICGRSWPRPRIPPGWDS
jgi:hypothetical protein